MIIAAHINSHPRPTLPTRLSLGDGIASVKDRRRLERKLRAAAAAGAFILHYQPRLSLATGVVKANEALIRWPDRKLGLMPPHSFIPVAWHQPVLIPASINGMACGAARPAPALFHDP